MFLSWCLGIWVWNDYNSRCQYLGLFLLDVIFFPLISVFILFSGQCKLWLSRQSLLYSWALGSVIRIEDTLGNSAVGISESGGGCRQVAYLVSEGVGSWDTVWGKQELNLLEISQEERSSAWQHVT